MNEITTGIDSCLAQQAFAAQLRLYGAVVPEIAQAVVAELAQQRQRLKLIASENYCSLPCQLAMGNWLTDKYAEGTAGHRFYAGCEQVDIVEDRAAALAQRLFAAEYAYVQAHSGADANMIAYWAILTVCVETPLLEEYGQQDLLALSDQQWHDLRHKLGNQRLLAPHVFSGGHLTHGYRHNLSGRMFDAHYYHVSASDGLLDYDEIARQAEQVKPLILLAGYSAYPRRINFRRFREIADRVGAILFVDMSHFAGLVAGKIFTGDYDPVPFADIVTSTTHKTLRGPRGGLILAKKTFAPAINRGCPMVIGGPLPHVMAAKAIAFQEALQPEFKEYAQAVVDNSSALAAGLIRRGVTVLSGGSENHILLLDTRPLGLTGRQAELALLDCGITANRNTLPNDSNGPWYTSGVRIGTAAISSLGMRAAEMAEIAEIIASVLTKVKPATITTGERQGEKSPSKYLLDAAVAQRATAKISSLLSRFPAYPELNLAELQQLVQEL